MPASIAANTAGCSARPLPADIARPTLQRLHSQDRRKTLKVLSLLALGVPTASQLPWGVWQADLRTTTGEQSRLTLADGVLDARSRFNTPLPGQPFYILMDAGPGEMFEVDWRDVVGIDQQHFEVTSNTF